MAETQSSRRTSSSEKIALVPPGHCSERGVWAWALLRYSGSGGERLAAELV